MMNKAKWIKLLLLPIFLFAAFSVFAQKQKNIMEKQYLKRIGNKYFTYKKDNSVFLKKRETVKNVYKGELINYSVQRGDTIRHYKVLDSIIVDTFRISDFDSLKTPRFKGYFKQEKTKLYFYPWRFKDTSNVELNKELQKYTYFIDIPKNTVVRTNFNSFQFGSLTLPAKVYLSSTKDTLVNNVQTGINFNIMLGRKWGTKKYYYKPSEKKGTSYEKAFSINLIFGVAKIDLDDKNTKPALDKSYSIAGLSSGFAFGYQYRDIGAYIGIGIDTPLWKFGGDWIFKNKPWIGFGLGLGL